MKSSLYCSKGTLVQFGYNDKETKITRLKVIEPCVFCVYRIFAIDQVEILALCRQHLEIFVMFLKQFLCLIAHNPAEETTAITEHCFH